MIQPDVVDGHVRCRHERILAAAAQGGQHLPSRQLHKHLNSSMVFTLSSISRRGHEEDVLEPLVTGAMIVGWVNNVIAEMNRGDTETQVDDLSHQAAPLCLYGSTVLCKSSGLCLREHMLFEPATHAREVRLLAGEGGLELGRHLGVPEFSGQVNE